MKKKLVVLACVLALLSGCATYWYAKNLLCNPTLEQQVAAQNAVAFVDSALVLMAGTVWPGAGDMMAKLQVAKLVFANVRDKICVTLDQLEAALGVLDNTALVIASDSAKRRATPPVVPNLDPLRAALKGR